MMSWFSKAIIYHIFIDRFAGFDEKADPASPFFCGGNLKGILNKLDCIKELGVTAIWISPFYKTTAYHGYHIADFDAVDERFGNRKDLEELIETSHNKNLKIIADIVPNHCSNKHPWFTSAISDRKSSYYNWFYFNDWPHNYLRFLEFDDLPKINLENPETAEYMIHSLCNWAKLGFDGFRIDHILGIPDSFLRKLRKRLLSINPEFVLIGEAWSEGIRHKNLKTLKFRGKNSIWNGKLPQVEVQKHYTGLIDGVLDFGWRDLVLKNLKRINNNSTQFIKLEKEYSKNFSSDLILPRFLDNHDTNRIMFECKNNKELFRKVLKQLSQQEHPIIIYYGTEWGFSHKKALSPHIPFSDLMARATAPWKADAEYLSYISDLMKKR
jgi:glycosidase